MKKQIITLVGTLLLLTGCSQTYTNEEYNFSIEIPSGPYSVPEETSGTKDLYISNIENDSQFVEMTIRIENGTLDNLKNLPQDTLVKEEDIEINNVKGKLLHYAYFLPGATEPVEGDGCPVYVLDDERGHLYNFRLWECLNSPIFEKVVNSFELLEVESMKISDEMIKKHDLMEEEVLELENMGVTDENIDAWVDEMKAMGVGPFDINAELKDVTGGPATGFVTAGFINESEYVLRANFEGLVHPMDGHFYEGWVVRKNPLSVISTGVATRSLGDYFNSFSSEEDLSDHIFYVLTLEPDDGDPSPASHVLEGTMK